MSRRRLLVLITCALATVPIRAQPPATDPVITIAQAVDEAVARNLTLLAERANLSIADAAMLTARLRPNPVVSFSADHLDLLGTHFDAVNSAGPSEYAWRIDLPVERGGKRDARLEVASLGRTAAAAQLNDAIRSLTMDVRLACVDLLAAKATRTLVADNLRTFEELARVNRARVVAGSIAPVESTRSEIAMLQFRSSLTRAELDLVAATARLRTLLGRAPGQPLDLADDLDPGRGPDLAGAEHLDQLALEKRPDLQALEAARGRSVADLRLQEALGRVDYTIGAEYRRQQGIAGRGNSLGFFLSAPLPIWNRNQGEIARAGAESTEVERLIAARRATIVADVRAAYNEYITNEGLLTAIDRDLISPAMHAREVSTYLYKTGGSTLLELLDAQRAFNDTMQSRVDAQAGLRRAAVRLNAAVGVEVVP